MKSKARDAKRKARRETVVENVRKSGALNPLELIIRVKNMANEVGGIKELKKLVDLLAE